MRALLLLALVLVAIATAQADRCSYTCRKTSYYSCGWWGWRRCSRSYNGRCYGTCSWTESSRGACSATCGGGTQTVILNCRGSRCNHPTSRTKDESCNTHHCPVDGGWSDWDDWVPISKCTALCGGGELNRKHDRTCTKPAPRYGGKDCDGVNTETEYNVPCNEAKCGARCPIGNNTYIASAEDKHDYYHCIPKTHNTSRAILRTCAPGTEWNQDAKSCVHEVVSTTTTTTTTAAPPCNELDYEVKDDCSRYRQCVNGEFGLWQPCSAGLKFDKTLKICNWASQVTCN